MADTHGGGSVKSGIAARKVLRNTTSNGISKNDFILSGRV